MPKIVDILEGRLTGKEVELQGWIYRTRSSGGVVFAVIRDSSGIVQVTVKKGQVPDEDFQAAERALIESAVTCKGAVVEDSRAPGGYEVRASGFHVVHFAEDYPIGKDQSEEFLLDMRHLWVRSQRMVNVLKIRSTVFGAIHEYFRGEGFHEVQSPSITPVAAEGGATLFTVDYFGRKAYLTQTWQLYAEAMVMGLEKIYCIAPSFRAEKSRTSRHLAEYWHAEMEVAWEGLDAIMDHAERMVSHVCRRVLEANRRELKALDRDPARLEGVEPPFPRMTYTDAVDMLRDRGADIEWGKDLRTLEERELMADHEKPLFVTHYPRDVKAFYMRVAPDDPDTVLCYDLLAPETGDEIIGGSEREPDIHNLLENLDREGEDPKAYEWYLDLRRYGSVQHAGFGLGVDRLVQWICGLKHIRDATAFPRTMTRWRP